MGGFARHVDWVFMQEKRTFQEVIKMSEKREYVCYNTVDGSEIFRHNEWEKFIEPVKRLIDRQMEHIGDAEIAIKVQKRERE